MEYPHVEEGPSRPLSKPLQKDAESSSSGKHPFSTLLAASYCTLLVPCNCVALSVLLNPLSDLFSLFESYKPEARTQNPTLIRHDPSASRYRLQAFRAPCPLNRSGLLRALAGTVQELIGPHSPVVSLRIWLWVYYSKIPIYPIFHLLMGDYTSPGM